ncbi:probable LRR receptor-like serine/threonine-protein kinase At1g05700 [Vitis riparia]|uniref:probable LRR receptor-like serine/threonine-protein kinase At1g05700 n=1 Tax=Vitis riparia TaxID=96939 RepID=UPI00155A392C|nr:probable LRR receptor-like serine/threonine-protein kinase At1g05700 [Vitis riparia]
MANLLILILLALSTLSGNLAGFLSIDCGSSTVYSDEGWIGDEAYIQNGESKRVQSGNSVSQVMDTLRVFSSRNKNCYSLVAKKGERVLVRASFYYGNYDHKSSPPTFALQFDGNPWATVVTSSDLVIYYEAIYAVKGDTTSVCVAQTQANQFPFISALEMASLGSNMYSSLDSNYALFLRRRFAFGANEIIRFQRDAYDRIWVPGVAVNGLIAVTSDALVIDSTAAKDVPPQAVLQNAITTLSTSESIIIGTNLPAVKVLIYINAYFSEVTTLDSTQKRSLEINLDDKPVSNPIVPPYQKVLEVTITNLTASSNNNLSLVATSDSTLPPLINALEIFSISNELTDGTDSNDVGQLGSLQVLYPILRQWGGDPCLPSPFTWDWVNCSTDATPRVTALYLSGFELNGSFPDLSSMDALEIIDLHNNSLEGDIPDYLGTMPNLKQLNLADNDFSGTLPTSISNNKNLKLIATGNKNLCVSGKSCQTSDTNTGNKNLFIYVVVPTFLLVWK